MALISAFICIALFLAVGISLASHNYLMALLFFVVGVGLVVGGMILGKRLQAKHEPNHQ